MKINQRQQLAINKDLWNDGKLKKKKSLCDHVLKLLIKKKGKKKKEKERKKEKKGIHAALNHNTYRI